MPSSVMENMLWKVDQPKNWVGNPQSMGRIYLKYGIFGQTHTEPNLLELRFLELIHHILLEFLVA